MLHNAAGNNRNDEAAKLRPLEILTVYMSLGATVLSIILWISIVSFGDEWIKKRNLFYSIDTDLLHVYVGHGFVGKAFQKAAEHLSGDEIAILQAFPHKKFYLEEFREFICTLPKIPGYTVNLCLMWTGVQYGSWMMLFGVVLGTIFMAIAGVLLYWYAFIKARKITRVFYKLFYILAPLVQITATAGYVSATIHFGRGHASCGSGCQRGIQRHVLLRRVPSLGRSVRNRVLYAGHAARGEGERNPV